MKKRLADLSALLTEYYNKNKSDVNQFWKHKTIWPSVLL
jgi:hypothetical protein